MRRRGQGTVTLKEVARYAGVGTMTASRALNAPDTVSDQLRAKVETAVRALGYVPNRYAGTLASAQTKLVTVIVPSLSSRVFAEIVRGADDVLSPLGYQIMVSNTSYGLDDEERVLRTVLGWRPEGVIVSGIDHNEATRAMLRDAGVTVVEALELGEDPIDVNIGLSHLEAGRAAGAYLVDRGHRRIGFLGAQMAIDFRAQRRYRGFCEALSSAGIDLLYEGLAEEASGFDVGGREMARLLREGPSLQALFCVNDELAVGAIGECLRRGVDVPGKLAVLGFNDLDVSAQIVPALTTIRSPRERMGRLAAEAVLAGRSGERPERRIIDVGFELIRRQSA